MTRTWFLFDIGNVLIRLDYEGVLAGVRSETSASTDEIVRGLGRILPDFEKGGIDFSDVYEQMRKRAGYLGSEEKLRRLWASLLSSPIDGSENLLDRVREQYRVAYLSNCNEVHAGVIAGKFRALFGSDEPIIYSHEVEAVKPEIEIYRKALARLEAEPEDVIFVDDMLENVTAARSVGIEAHQFESPAQMTRLLEQRGLLAPEPG